jgi:hypothetical protein
MLKSMLFVSAAVTLAFVAPAAQATLLSSNIGGLSSPPVVMVAGGCGIGFHRGPYGGCIRNGYYPPA